MPFTAWRVRPHQGSGCIGITTSPFFVDAGGPASTLPLSTIAPARPSLKALTLSFEKVTLSAVHCVVSQRDLSDEAVYLGFDRPFGEQPVSLFLALDPARPEEVKPEAPRLSLPSLLSIAAVGPTPGSSTPLAIEDGTAGLVRSGLCYLRRVTSTDIGIAVSAPALLLAVPAYQQRRVARNDACIACSPTRPGNARTDRDA